MKERPILFSAPMVRALLDGSKTQSRRIVKPQPFNGRPDDEVRKQMIENGALGQDASLTDLINGAIDHGFIPEAKCPYGHTGDRLWVRETYFGNHFQHPNEPEDERELHYRADGLPNFEGEESLIKWRPSIFMPRWASRITLEITGVRVERLNDISEEDAKAEGLKGITKDGKLVKYGIPDADGYPGTDDIGWPWEDWRISPVDAYRRLWESINGSGSWDANPWVWVVEFRMEAA